MKLITAKKTRKRIERAEYVKRCPCCGKTFRATYPMSDFLLSAQARDMVNENYCAHISFCAAANKVS